MPALKLAIPLATIFPLTLLAALAAPVAYLSVLFNSVTRWLFLAALIAFLLARARFFLVFRTEIGPALAAWIGWALITALWSQLPALSLLKGAALAATLPALVSGGIYWTRRGRPGDPMSYLLPLVILALGAGLLGFGRFRGVRGISLFIGLTDNANMFAALIAMALPYPLLAAWRATAKREGWWRLLAWLLVAVALLVMLVLTRSRGAAVIAACTMVTFALATLSRRTLMLGGLSALILAAGIATLHLSAPIITEPVRRFIDKGMEGGLFETRRGVWVISYEHARLGGLVGLGLGVSADAAAPFEGVSTAVNYGREKGSSPLAIIEETGLVGLALSLMLIAALIAQIAGGFRNASAEERVPLALVAGVLSGLLVQSLFEGWWLSPGSGATMFFWGTAGVAIGMAGPATGHRCAKAISALA